MNSTTAVPVQRFTVALWNHPIATAGSDGTVVITTHGKSFLRQGGLAHCETEVCRHVRRMVATLEPKHVQSLDTDTGLRVTRVNA